MKYTNINIRKSYKNDTVLTVVGAVFCLISLLLCFTSIYSANKAKNNVRPMKEILSEGDNHAGKPAFLEISEMPVKVGKNRDEVCYLVTDGSAYYISGMTKENYKRFISSYEFSERMYLEGITYVISDKEVKNQIADSLSGFLCEQDEFTHDGLACSNLTMQKWSNLLIVCRKCSHWIQKC